jgi:hypothetical protein
MKEKALARLVGAQFTQKHVDAAVGHYQTCVEEFQLGKWENSIAKGGKFVEAVLKALWTHVGETVPAGRGFKADTIITGLAKKPASVDDTVRLTIPRACRLVYDVASNRGGRHDAGEVDPNQMDASMVAGTCSWILAEMLRFSQKGAIDLTSVAEMVASLNQRKFPFMEDIDGRLYFSLRGLSARDVVILTLWRMHPGRVNKQELVAAAKRHGNSGANAAVAMSRLTKLVDDDGEGNLRLLLRGIQEAEELLASKHNADGY